MKRVVLNSALVLASLLLLALMAEGVLRAGQAWWGWEPISAHSLARTQTPHQSFNARLKRSDNPRLVIEFDTADPNINSAGFRGGEFPVGKDPHTVRIAVLGDSVAYGYSVAGDESFPSVLERALQEQGRAVEVLNFAVNGYGSSEQAELLVTRVWHYQPDIVLLVYVLNDPVPPVVMMNNVGAAMRAAARLDKLGRQSQVLAGLYWSWMNAVHNLVGRGDLYRGFYEDEANWRRVVDAIATMKSQADARQVPLLAVVFPLLREPSDYRLQYAHEQIGALLKQLQIPFMDLYPVFAAQDHRQFQLIPEDDTHPNAAGHQLAADALLPFVQPWVLRQMRSVP